jgi:excisionase family DNA binding protein
MGYGSVSVITGLSVRTLKRLVKQRAIPHIRYSAHSVRFDRDAIAAWKAARTVTPDPKENP